MGATAPWTLPATSGECATYYMMVSSGGISPQMGAAVTFDPCTGPQIRGVLLRSRDHDTLALQVSHVAVDGRGVIETLYRLSEIHRTLGADPAWEPSFNSGADRALASAAAGDEDLESTLAQVVERTSAWKNGGMLCQKAVGSGSADAMSRRWRLKLIRPVYVRMDGV